MKMEWTQDTNPGRYFFLRGKKSVELLGNEDRINSSNVLNVIIMRPPSGPEKTTTTTPPPPTLR